MPLINRKETNLDVGKPYGKVMHIFLAVSIIVVLHHIVMERLLLLLLSDVIKAIIMQLFSIIIPGIALYLLLYKAEQSFFGVMCISYILGYSWNIISYFLMVPFGLKHLMPYFVVVCAVVSVWIIIKKGRHIALKKVYARDCVFYVLFLAQLLLCSVSYSGANASPYITESAWMPVDHLFWIENAAALAKCFPAFEPRADVGCVLYYHYFSSIQIAFSSIVTGVDCFTLGTSLYAVTKSFVFFGALYVFVCSLTDNFWLQILGIIAIAFSCGFESITLVSYLSHIWTHPFGFDLGIAFGMFFLHCFYLQWKKAAFDFRLFLLTLLSFMICTGLKAPVAVVVIVAAGIICFCWLFKKKRLLALSYGIALLAVFFLVSVCCIGLFSGTTESRTGAFTIWDNIYASTDYLHNLYWTFDDSIPKILIGILMELVYHVDGIGVLFLLFLLSCISFVVDKDMQTEQMLGLLLAAFLGMVLGAHNVQYGYSQMYFTMSAVIPCLAMALIWLDYKWKAWNIAEKRFASVLLAGSLCVQICFFFCQGDTYWGRGLNSAIELGYKNLFNKEQAWQDKREDGVQKEDMIALRWIRENTPEDSIVLSDRSVVGEMGNYMYYGTFSERQAYLEGDIYYREQFAEERDRMRMIVERVYQNDNNALKAAIAHGVDYVIQTKWLTPDFLPNTDILTCVFSSETINVYMVIS